MDSLEYLKSKMAAATPVATEVNTAEPVVENATESAQAQTEAEPVTTEVTAEAPKVENEQLVIQDVIDNKESEAVQETPSKKQFASEQVAELNNFLERNPDKTIDDYQRMKRPAESIGDDELIKQYLAEKEGKTASEIALEMKKLEVSDLDDDDEFGDSEANLEARAKRERAILEARTWYSENQKELFSAETQQPTPNEASEPSSYDTVYQQLLDEGKKLQETAKQDYYTKSYQALSEISDITMDVYGEEVRLAVDDNMKKILRTSLDVEKSLGKFYDEKGSLTDAKGYLENLAWWDVNSRAILLAKRDEQVEARVKADSAKNRRNVTLDSSVPTNVTATSDATKEKVDSWLKGNYSKF